MMCMLLSVEATNLVEQDVIETIVALKCWHSPIKAKLGPDFVVVLKLLKC